MVYRVRQYKAAAEVIRLQRLFEYLPIDFIAPDPPVTYQRNFGNSDCRANSDGLNVVSHNQRICKDVTVLRESRT